ncbi:MAG: hypothetical protein AABX54_02425 [Nanoarchaeota archaeon]
MERYEIVLAAPFEKCETDGRRFFFYERLEHCLVLCQKRLFLPHKQLAKLENPNPVAESVIRESELVLADIGIPSIAAGIMLQMGIDYAKPIISFRNFNDPYDGRSDEYLEGALGIARAKRLTYGRDEDGIDIIMSAVKEFYGIR